MITKKHIKEGKDLCNKCGRCCYHNIDGKLIKCKYLIKISPSKSICRIYPNRLGKIIYIDYKGNKHACNERVNVHKNYKDCPYNKDEYND